MRRAVCVLAVLAVVVTSAPATSAAIRFKEVQYDPPGADTRSNLNQEFVVVRNSGADRVDLSGWWISSGRRQYTFRDFRLGPGKIVFVHTGSGTQARRHLYWGRERHAWTNGTGGVNLWSAPLTSRLVDTCMWFSIGDGHIDC